MFPQASELYEKLFTSHMTQLQVTDQSQDGREVTWFKEWAEPVLDVLSQNNTVQKKHTIEVKENIACGFVMELYMCYFNSDC